MMRQTSRTDTLCSQLSGSMVRTHLITEASSVFPSLSFSTFSLEVNADGQEEARQHPELFGQTNRFDEGLSSSCKEGLDVFDNPDYTDTVKSTDSTGSMLRRSLSVPPQYTYKGSVHKHAREVFEDFIIKDGSALKENREEEDDEGEQDEEQQARSDGSTGSRPWRQTMEDLLERPDYVDSLQSTSSGTALLAKTAIRLTAGEKSETQLVNKEQSLTSAAGVRQQLEKKYIKNLIVVSVSCFFLFGAYLSLRNLQSSINKDSGLALYSLSSLYLCFFLGCIFAPTIIQYLRPKCTMLFAQVIILAYIGTNFYPTYYTLLPASLFVGVALACFWTAHSTYLTSIGLCYADLLGKHPTAVLTRFNGIFFMFFGISQVLGNVISSTVLMAQNGPGAVEGKTHPFPQVANLTYAPAVTTVETEPHTDGNALLNLDVTTAAASDIDQVMIGLPPPQCGANYVASQQKSTSGSIDRHVVYILLGIFSAMVLLSMAVMVFFLDRLEGDVKRQSKSLGRQLISVFRWFLDCRALCLVGLFFYSLIQMAFIFGEFTKAFVTCAMGVHMVGYAMLTMSAFSSLSAYFSGKLVKYIGRPTVMSIAGFIHFVLLMWLVWWQPVDGNIVPLLVFMGSWGVADGVWITQTVSIVGGLFVENKESAFAAVKMCQSLGACLTLASAKYISFRVKVYIISGLLAVSMVTYLFMEFQLWREARQKLEARKPEQIGEKKKNLGPTSV